MSRQPLFVPLAVLLIACLAALPACKKKSADSGSGSEGSESSSGSGATVPQAVSTEHLLFAHLKSKDIRDSAIFKEIMQAVAKFDGTAEWDKFEADASRDIGVKLTEIDSVTACVTELSTEGKLKYIVILSANTPINKSKAFGYDLPPKPDSRDLYPAGKTFGFAQPGKKPPEPKTESYIHFPDAKTVVLLSAELAQQYLDGYGKNRTGWPLNADLTRAAAGYTLFATVQMDKLPREKLSTLPQAKEFGSLLSARTVTLTANLKGKELSVGVRAAFPDAAAAGKAKDTVQKAFGMATSEIETVMKKEEKDIGPLMPVVKEAHRALKEVKVDVSGSDLTIAGSYKANFDIGVMVADVVKKMREENVPAKNNLKQIGIGLHNYHDAYNRFPIHGVGQNGPLRNATDKPLLSWRVAILPYIEQDNLYKEFRMNEAWDSPHNKKLIDKMPKIFASDTKTGKPGHTHYQMIVGPNAMRPFGESIANITDGTSNTIAVVEAATPVIWTKPDDVMLTGKELPTDLKKKFARLQPNGFYVLLWDGSVRFVRDSVSDQTLGLLINPRDGQPIPDW